MTVYEMASEMLTDDVCAPLHPDLCDALERANRLAGGNHDRWEISRSAIATVIVAWELANPDKEAVPRE